MTSETKTYYEVYHLRNSFAAERVESIEEGMAKIEENRHPNKPAMLAEDRAYWARQDWGIRKVTKTIEDVYPAEAKTSPDCPRCGIELCEDGSCVSHDCNRVAEPGETVLCLSCGFAKARYNQSQDKYICTDKDCNGVRMTKERIKRYILEDGLSLTDMIDVVCDLNGFVGVGYLTFGDQIGEYIRAKAKSRRSLESWLNS